MLGKWEALHLKWQGSETQSNIHGSRPINKIQMVVNPLYEEKEATPHTHTVSISYLRVLNE